MTLSWGISSAPENSVFTEQQQQQRAGLSEARDNVKYIFMRIMTFSRLLEASNS